MSFNREVVFVSQQLYATVVTNQGNIRVKLFPEQARKTVDNFVELADTKKFFDGTIFHRIIDGFMIQGGDPTGTGRGGPGYTFEDEFHPDLSFDRPYLLAMANAGPHTNGSQFFITVGATAWLNNKHTIFGEVADQESKDVVDLIAKSQTDGNDRPVQEVQVERVTIDRLSE